jgi:hypothetical protein
MANQDIQTTLYNGKHSIIFKNGTHRYYVDTFQKQGVTTIMSKVLAKPGLMLWPMNMALKHLESKLPTITIEDFAAARKAHIEQRDKGAGVGTIVHAVVEHYLAAPHITTHKHLSDLGINSDSPEYTKEVLLALQGFEAWHDQTQPETIAIEQIVYSASKDYTGTFDSILRINGKNYLVDLKTTNASKDAPKGIYAENFVQLGAYLYAYEEQRQYELTHGGTKLVEIDDLMVLSCKKNGTVHTLTASEVGLTTEDCSSLWVSTLFLYEKLVNVKNKIGGKDD